VLGIVHKLGKQVAVATIFFELMLRRYSLLVDIIMGAGQLVGGTGYQLCVVYWLLLCY
jgi:hypothetical protein